PWEPCGVGARHAGVGGGGHRRAGDDARHLRPACLLSRARERRAQPEKWQSRLDGGRDAGGRTTHGARVPYRHRGDHRLGRRRVRRRSGGLRRCPHRRRPARQRPAGQRTGEPMSTLLRMEFGKLVRLTSVRFGLVVLLVFPLLWAYAPGIFEVYGFFLVSGYQVPALSLLSSMQFLLPLLAAITAAELLGMEIANGTLPTVLLR